MFQLFFNNAVVVASCGIIIVGILGTFALIAAATWKLLDYFFRNAKAVNLIVEYASHRKAFKKWLKENPNRNVYTPKIKERGAK